jgi:hypothetical protein
MDPSRGEISDLFNYLKTVIQDEEYGVIDKEGKEEAQTVIFLNFL